MGLSMGRRLVLESSVSRFEPSSAGDCAARGAFWIFRTGDVRFRESLFQPDAPIQNSAPPPFIKVSRYKGVTQVRFVVEMIFDLESGRSREWQRLKIANFE